MNIDDSAAENIVLQQDGDGGGGGGGGRNTGVPSTRSGGKRRDPDPAFTPGPEFKMEDEDEYQVYTQDKTIEALRALSEENVRKPTYSQVAQIGSTPLNEDQKVTVPSSPKGSSAPSPCDTTSELLASTPAVRKSALPTSVKSRKSYNKASTISGLRKDSRFSSSDPDRARVSRSYSKTRHKQKKQGNTRNGRQANTKEQE